MTNKRNATKQIAQRHLREAATQHRLALDASGAKQSWEEIPFELHHHISSSKNYPLPLAAFIRMGPNDPAKKVCRFFYV